MAARYRLYELARFAGRTVFFDTNILIYLFWPTGNARCEMDYAKFLSACIKGGIPMALDFLVVSEAANRMLRAEYEKACARMGDLKDKPRFKSFRDSEDGRQAQADIYAVLSKILVRFMVIGKAFSADDIAGFLAVDRLDLVDKAIADICRGNDFVLATHDADFAAVDIDIVSASLAYS